MNTRPFAAVILLAALIMILAACGSPNDDSPFDPAAGHSADWAIADSHGVWAKARPSGFSSCQSCHGESFSGGTANIACSSCHGVVAPHPAAPWRGARTHANTDQGNAPVCALCHTGGANSSVSPAAPAPAGTAPGCFNSTLCHGAAAGHPADWSDPARHGATAEQDFSVCASCHGRDYRGGSTSTTCYQCHQGPGLDHPAASWVIAGHRTAAQADMTVCQKCHGADYLGGGSHIACSSCHMEDRTRVHLLAWYPDVQANHRAYALANGTASCGNQYCHGADLAGVAQSGPSCSTCHTWPFTGGACGSCHGDPPSGTSFPNTAGGHLVHAALGAAVTCATCHSGAGSGTALHQNAVADMALASDYNAESGAASYNSAANACSSVSCHGGQTTPDWFTGTINVSTQCAACHASGTAQFNSYSSGRHTLHVGRNITCTRCHDTVKLAASHFTTLNTTAMEGPASATTATALNYNGTTCNPSAGGLSGCHGSQSW